MGDLLRLPLRNSVHTRHRTSRLPAGSFVHTSLEMDDGTPFPPPIVHLPACCNGNCRQGRDCPRRRQVVQTGRWSGPATALVVAIAIGAAYVLAR